MRQAVCTLSWLQCQLKEPRRPPEANPRPRGRENGTGAAAPSPAVLPGDDCVAPASANSMMARSPGTGRPGGTVELARIDRATFSCSGIGFHRGAMTRWRSLAGTGRRADAAGRCTLSWLQCQLKEPRRPPESNPRPRGRENGTGAAAPSPPVLPGDDCVAPASANSMMARSPGTGLPGGTVELARIELAAFSCSGVAAPGGL